MFSYRVLLEFSRVEATLIHCRAVSSKSDFPSGILIQAILWHYVHLLCSSSIHRCLEGLLKKIKPFSWRGIEIILSYLLWE